METKIHPIEIIEMLRDYLQMQDDNCMYNIPYIIEIADNYLKDYHCCAFCDNIGSHDNCPNLPGNSRSFYTDYHCGHYIDRRTGHNPDYYTEEEHQKFIKQGKNKIAWVYSSISSVKPEDGYIFALYGGAEEYRIEECASMKGACDYCDFKKQPECMSCKCCDRLNGKQYVFKKLTKNEKILYTHDHETYQKYNKENNNA